MNILLHAARLTLPTLFFGYAVAANLSLLAEPLPRLAQAESGYLSGGLTRDFDGLYKAGLPHTGPSFGLIGAARFVLLHEARKGVVVGSEGWLFSSEETRPIPSEAALVAIAEHLRAIRDQLQRSGTKLVLLPLPAKIDVARVYSPDPAQGQALEALYARFGTILAAEGLVLVDARKALISGKGPGFFATDTHWTPDGALRVARAVALTGAVERGDLAFDRSAGPSKALTGDLVAFVTTPALAPQIGLPDERIEPVMQTPLTPVADIFADAAPDIVLVGTSYSANPDWGFAESLMAALGRDVVSMAEEGQGPLLPMQDYLSSAGFANAPPKVVIWEIPIRYLTDPTLWTGGASRAPGITSSLTGQNADG